MIFVLWTRQQLLKTLRLIFLFLLLVALVLGVYGVVRTGEVMANRARESYVSERPSASQTAAREEKSGDENLFDKLIKKLKSYHKGNL